MRRVLEALPPELKGLSKHELAEGLLGRRDPRAYGRVCRALEEVEAVLGGLHVRRGRLEDVGLYDVELFGIPAHKMAGVRAFLRGGERETVRLAPSAFCRIALSRSPGILHPSEVPASRFAEAAVSLPRREPA